MAVKMQQSPLGLSWMGTSCLCPEEAKRELAALRAKPMLRKDISQPLTMTTSGRQADGCRGTHSPSRSGVTSTFRATKRTTSLGRSKPYRYPTASRDELTTDQAIRALQVEVRTLQAALFRGNGNDTSDYRLAQASMDRLDRLEGALWEAHRREASAATLGETRKLQETHKVERSAIEADLKHRRDGLERSCREQVLALRRAHESRLADLDRVNPASVAPDGAGEDWLASGGTDPTTPSPPPTQTTAAVVLEPASRSLGSTGAKPPHPEKGMDGTTTVAISAADSKREGDGSGAVEKEGQAWSGLVQAQSATAMAPVAVAIGSSRAKALVDLRSELGRHLAAVAHVLDGGRHLQEATRVMREIDKAEALERLDAEAKARGLATGLEMIAVHQKQAQAEEVQRDKHERLRRSLESSGTEDLRLLSARQRGALGRLAVRCRAAKHDREVELRGQLARVKGGVARLWREHNRSRFSHGPRSNGAGAGAGGKLSGAEGEGHPSSSLRQENVARTRKKHDGNTVVDSSGEEGNDAGPGGEGEEADGDREEGGASGTELVDENPSCSGRRSSGNDRMSPDETARDSSTSATTEGERKVKEGTASAASVFYSQGNQEKKEETQAALSRSPAAKSGRRSTSKREGAPWRRRKRITTAAAVTTVSAVKNADTDALLGDELFGVLSEGEAQALAALGRGAPDDPRLLLSTCPLPPQWRRRHRPVPSSRTRLDRLTEDGALESSGDNGLGSGVNTYGAVGDGVDSVEGGRRAVAEGGIPESDEAQYAVLDRAMEKLARKIQAEEDLSRRKLGMAPLSMR